MNSCQEESLRRGGPGGNQLRLRIVEEGRHLLEGPPAPAHPHHRAHQVAYHVVQKAIGGDVEGDSHLIPLDPGGFGNDASISPVFLSGLCEGPEGMVPKDQARGLTEELHIYIFDEGPAPGVVKGGGRFRNQSELVSVTSGDGVEPRVEVLRNLDDLPYPDIVREESIQGPVKLRNIPPGFEGQRHDLPCGVDSTVRPSGGGDGVPFAGEAREGIFELTLHGSAPGLELPAQEIGPVVLEGQAKTSLGF